jgi:hypothetical protein
MPRWNTRLRGTPPRQLRSRWARERRGSLGARPMRVAPAAVKAGRASFRDSEWHRWRTWHKRKQRTSPARARMCFGETNPILHKGIRSAGSADQLVTIARMSPERDGPASRRHVQTSQPERKLAIISTCTRNRSRLSNRSPHRKEERLPGGAEQEPSRLECGRQPL